ncbi:SIS domain-containing protein, partial [Francisella tularensis subsp. holarctica]|nr:SIS domain-containing protein [Francisella tularensis subsp. holarctica]
MTTIMHQEAISSFAKVANPLKLNKDITKSILKILKEKNIKRIITIAMGSSYCVENFSKYLFET